MENNTHTSISAQEKYQTKIKSLKKELAELYCAKITLLKKWEKESKESSYE